MTIDLPSGRQSFDFDCGAQALQMVFAYFGMDVREGELWESLQVGNQGTPIKNIISLSCSYIPKVIIVLFIFSFFFVNKLKKK